MNKRWNSLIVLLCFTLIISAVFSVFDKDIFKFYQLRALSLFSTSSSSITSFLYSLPLPIIERTTIVIVISILLVIIVVLFVIQFLFLRRKKNSEVQKAPEQLEIKEQVIDKISAIQTSVSVDLRLTQYVRDAQAAGLSNEIISQKLREAGWPEDAVRQALL